MPSYKHENDSFVPPWVRQLFDLGVQEQSSSWGNNVTRLLNQLVLLLSIANFVLVFYHLTLGNSLSSFLAGFSLLINVGILLLQYKERLFAARLVAAVYYPLLIFAMINLSGGSLGGEYIFFTVSFICAILFQQRWFQLMMAAYVIGLYSLSQWILTHDLAPFTHQSQPFDHYIFFVVSLLSLYFLANSFFRQIVNHRQEREKLVEQLIASNTKLKQMNYVVSHDLRSPLRRIASFTDLAQLANQRDQKDLADEYLQTVKSSACKLHDFIHDMLAFAQLDDQSIALQPMQLDELLTESMEQFQETNVLIAVTNMVEKATFLGNKTLMGVVFQNLIENAIKYNESVLPQIDISLHADQDGIALRFSDNGIGIPEEKQEEIFEIFTRLHDSSQYEGTGIGLATVKGIIELHRGTIQVEPQSQGACFLISLPLFTEEQQVANADATNNKTGKVLTLVRKRRAILF